MFTDTLSGEKARNSGEKLLDLCDLRADQLKLCSGMLS